MTTIAFPASVVPAGYTVGFDVPAFLQPESIVGVQGTSVPGTATESGRTYHFWFQRRTNGEVFNLGLSCNNQPIKPHHKAALRAVILAAYRYATQAADMGVQHDMHVEAELNARTADTVDLSDLCNVELIGDCLPATLARKPNGRQRIRQGSPCYVVPNRFGAIVKRTDDFEWASAYAVSVGGYVTRFDGRQETDVAEADAIPVPVEAVARPAPRACAMRASGTADAVLVAGCDDDRSSSALAPRYTLARLRQLDFAALWASVSPEKQAEIGAMVLRQECANQVALDGGFNTTADDRGEANAISDEILNALPAVIEGAIPDELPMLYDDPYPLWQILRRPGEGEAGPLISVRGVARRCRPAFRDGSWFVRSGGNLIELGGAVDLASRDPDAPPVWEYVSLADIEAERLRRHPERIAAV